MRRYLKNWIFYLWKIESRGDLIQIFKYFKGYDKINFHRQPEIIDNERKTRGHNMKLMR